MFDEVLNTSVIETFHKRYSEALQSIVQVWTQFFPVDMLCKNPCEENVGRYF